MWVGVAPRYRKLFPYFIHVSHEIPSSSLIPVHAFALPTLNKHINLSFPISQPTHSVHCWDGLCIWGYLNILTLCESRAGINLQTSPGSVCIEGAVVVPLYQTVINHTKTINNPVAKQHLLGALAWIYYHLVWVGAGVESKWHSL